MLPPPDEDDPPADRARLGGVVRPARRTGARPSGRTATIARWVAEQHGVEPLAWTAQAVTVSYERARGRRAVGEQADGFAITASKTVAVPVERLYDAFVDASLRERWLPAAGSASAPRRGRSRRASTGATARRGSNVAFAAKGDAKSTVALEHARLPDAEEAERMKAFWRERLSVLKSQLEGGGVDA